FAITAGAFVPLNFLAVRAATAYVHPRVLGQTSNLPGSMALTFLVCLGAVTLLFVTLCKYELAAKHTRAQVRALKRKLAAAAGEEPDAASRRRSAAPALRPTAGIGAPGQGGVA